jgi:hypothetical protein
MALTYWRMGHSVEALSNLEKAAAAVQAVQTAPKRERSGEFPWNERLILRLLRQEAESCLRPR